MRPTMALPFVVATLALSSGVIGAGKANTWELVGETGVSAQQLFLGVENNPATVGGHPAWATEYDTTTNTYRAMDIITNSFCAGGTLLGNGSWINAGGNNAVTTGGVSDSALNMTESTSTGAYKDLSGGRAQRLITPCDDEKCTWYDDLDGMPLNRWYPSLETLEDGSSIIIGGELWGGFVNDPGEMQNVPTYEFFPSRGTPVSSTFLVDSQPANLYPLTWLLPSGLLFLQASWMTTLMNYTTASETRLPNMTHAQRTYPGSAASAMLPLTKANSWEPTLLFCGGMDPKRDDWDQDKWAIVDTPTSDSCVSINPMDSSPTYADEDDLPHRRGMGNFIILPDQRLFLVNGVGYGSAGYGTQKWAQKYGQSYAREPILAPSYYNHSAPAGLRHDASLPNSTVNRMYHSSATILPDGSVFIAGSNPNADVITEANNASYPFKTEYRAERFYPSYYDAGRPEPSGIPEKITYGGDGFNLTLPSSSINGTANLGSAFVGLMRGGFSTHAINFGMRYVELESSYTGNSDGSATLHVAQLAPNPALLVPGPALLFVVINNIPSIGQYVMVGSGTIETQPLLPKSVLPASSLSGKATTSATGATKDSRAGSLFIFDLRSLLAVTLVAITLA